ncbi:MAG: hypothetical protein HPY59_13330 [Anaerolineae bacterium]|nr:hypothetical protein [Anaerolineae bacterium]
MEPPVLKQGTSLSPRGLKLWLALALVEGAAAFILLFAQPSESGRSLLLGYSLPRLALGLAALLVAAALEWLARRAWKDPAWLRAFCLRLDALMKAQGGLVPATFASGLLFLFLAVFTLVFSSRLSYRLQDWLFTYPAWTLHATDLMRAAFQRAGAVIVWAAALSLQTLLLILWNYTEEFKEKWRDGSIFKMLLILLMAGLSLFHWAVLIFQRKTFMLIPGWKWYITPKDLQPNQYGIFVALFFLALILIHFILSRPTSQRSMLILIALGYGLQVGFGFIAGGGFESIRLKYADSVFNGYAWAAAEQPPLYDALTHYESRYGTDRYLGTKPPGILLPYVATEKVASLLSPSASVEERFYKLTKLAAYVYPLMAFLLLPVLARFSRRLTGKPEDATLPAVLYILFPNVILIPMFLDQALYPLLFLLVLAGSSRALERPVFWGGFLAGAAGYIILYFSFSLLALLPFVIVWAGLEWLRERPQRSLRQTALFILGVLAGAVALLVVFRLFLNYDIAARYASAFANHRTTWQFATWQERVKHGFVLNNAEFATWSGFPIILLLLIRFTKAVSAFIRRQAGRLDSLSLTFLVIFVLLVAFGQTNGEVQRLYLFLTPLAALFSAEELKLLFKDRRNGFLFAAVLQLITTALIFHFQDFYG